MYNKLKTYAAILFTAAILLSCSKDKDNDDADKFIGTYTVSAIDHVTWGRDSKTLTDSGKLRISKISASRIKTTGIFATQGEVIGSTVYFAPITASDATGYFTRTFYPATITGNVLTINMYSSGKLEGYPFTSNTYFTATKQ